MAKLKPSVLKLFPTLIASFILTPGALFILSGVTSAAPVWNEDSYHANRWADFERQALAYINSATKTSPHYYTMLATAQQKQGKYDLAEKTLRKGINKHKDDPLIYVALADWLVLKAAKGTRPEAILLYETALKKVKPIHCNTYDYLPLHIAKVKKAPAGKPYPPVSEQLRKCTSDLKSCGLFKGRPDTMILYDALLAYGDTSKMDSKTMATVIAQLDTDRFMVGSSRFYTEVELKNLSGMTEKAGVPIMFKSEKMLNDAGARKVEFAVNGVIQKGTLNSVDQLFSLVNSGLKQTKCGRLLYRIPSDDPEEHVIGFLSRQEVDALAAKGLFKGLTAL